MKKAKNTGASKCIYNILGSNPNAGIVNTAVSAKTNNSKSLSPMSKPMTRTRIKVNTHRKTSGK